MNEDLAGHVASIFPDEPDDVPIFLSGEHGALLGELRQDLAAGRRFICVIGPAGSGKTRLMQALREDFERAHFEQSLIGLAAPSPKDPLLFALMEGLGLQVPDRDAPAARQRLSVILAMAEKKATPVLQIVDSAERLAPDELSTIFQLFGPSFTQVVLSGRPELLDLLADERRPLGVARPDVVRRLEGLAAADTDAYIRHRLWQARLPDDLFDTGASAAVHECSGGIPRSINAIAREALVRAEAAGEDRVDQAGVRAGGLGRAAATIPASRETPKAIPETAPPPASARVQEGLRPVPSAAPVPPEAAAVRAPAPQPDKTKTPQVGQRPAAAIPLIERAQQRDAQRAPPPKPEPQRKVSAASAKQVPHSATQRGPQPTKQASRPSAAEAQTAAQAGRAPKPSAPTPRQALSSASGGTPKQGGAAPRPSTEPPPSAAQPPQRGIKPAAAAPMARDRSAAQSKRSAVRAPGDGTERRPRGPRTALLAMATIAALAIGVGAIIGISIIREGSIVPGGTAQWIADMTGWQDRSSQSAADPPSLSASSDLGSGSDARPGTQQGGADEGAAPGATASTPPADETPDLAALSPAQAPTRHDAGSGNGGASAPGPSEESASASTAGAGPARQANDAQQVPEPPAATASAPQTDIQGAQPTDSRAADAAATPAPSPAPSSATAQDPAPPPPRTTAAAAPTPTRQAADPAPRAPAQPAAAVKPVVPSPGELARLYAVRAEYELKNGKPRDALVSVAYGLQADPEDNVLRELRARALQQLRVRAVQ
jgi:type II secretory pathway predicted ATPase ExeA